MPEVYLDGNLLDLAYGHQTSVGELAAGIEKELKGLKRFIMSMSIDGRLIEDWRNCPELTEPLVKRSNCSFVSASIESAVFDGICVLHELIIRVRENAVTGSKAFRTGRRDAAVIFSAVFDGLMDAIKTIDALIGGLGGRHNGIFRSDPREYYSRLLLILEEMNDANAAGDAIFMADILEHELAPLLLELEKEIFPPQQT